MLSTKKLIYKILNLPLVVEQSTSGGWRYRKWSDGTAECWRNYSASFWVNNAYGSVYMSNKADLMLPSGLFTSVPSVTTGGGTNAGASWISIASVTKDTITFRMMNGTSATDLSSTPSFYAIGRWK